MKPAQIINPSQPANLLLFPIALHLRSVHKADDDSPCFIDFNVIQGS